jgi:hypothetical protein
VLRADALALGLNAALERVALPLARTARAFVDCRGWFIFGHARLEDHARERFGRTGQWLRDFAALGDGLSRLPGLAEALAGDDGGVPLGRVAATQITRVASEESVGAWITLARRCTIRELKKAVRAARAEGLDRPLEPVDAGSESAGTAHDGETPGDAAGKRNCTASSDEKSAKGGAPGDATTFADDCSEDEERREVRFLVPRIVRVAFDETLALHRAVTGHEASVTSFVEALVGEALAGPSPPDVETAELRKVDPRVKLEAILARVTNNWAHLPAGRSDPLAAVESVKRRDDRSPIESAIGEATGAQAAAWGRRWPDGQHDEGILRAVERAARALQWSAQWERAGGPGGAVRLDAQIRGLLEAEETLQRELGRLLREMADRGAWARLMFNGAGHYAEQRLGLGRTVTMNRARLARSLDRFPRLREAHEAGHVGFDAALLVVQVLGRDPVDDATERAWVERAAECTVKRLRDEVRIIQRMKASALAAEPARCSFEAGRVVAGAEYQTKGEARSAEDESSSPVGSVARNVDGGRFRDQLDSTASAGVRPLLDADWHAAMRLDPGTLRERVLRLGAKGARAGARPDVFVRLRLPAEVAASFVAAVENRRRHLSRLADSVPWHEPWPEASAPPSLLAAREFSVRCRRAPAWIGLLALLEEFVAVWDDPAAMPDRRSDEVYRRDGWRCSAPGCTSRRNLEDHHVIYRSRGGGNAASNRVCVCRFHHQRGEHGGLASCRGKAPLNVMWQLGRRDVAVRYRNERRIDATGL